MGNGETYECNKSSRAVNTYAWLDKTLIARVRPCVLHLLNVLQTKAASFKDTVGNFEPNISALKIRSLEISYNIRNISMVHEVSRTRYVPK